MARKNCKGSGFGIVKLVIIGGIAWLFLPEIASVGNAVVARLEDRGVGTQSVDWAKDKVSEITR